MFKKYFLPLMFLFCINIPANDTISHTPYPKPHTPKLYIFGDFSSIEYHLGVLSELERLQVPVDTVVGMDWGSFVGALWSAGWNSGQIRELIRSWDSLPRAKDVQNSVLWKKTWLVKHNEDGKPAPVEISEDKPYFGQIFFDLMVQEALWRSEPGARVPFREADGIYPFPEEQGGHVLLSTLVALRDTNGTAAERYQQKLWNRDSNLIVLRPHSKPHPDSLFEAGIQAVQNKRTALGAAVGALPVVGALPATPLPATPPATPPPPRFLYHPVFDSVSAEYQGHLESLWNPGDTGILGVRNFLLSLQEDASYRSLRLTLDTGSFLQINTESSPLLSLSFYVFGGTFLGINAAADVNFRFINQFGYNLNLTAFYGQGARGVEPNLRFERFFMRDGDFFVKAKVFEYEPLSLFQKHIYEEARLLVESGRNIALGVEKPLGQSKSVLQIAVEIESKEIKTGASYYVDYEPVDNIYGDDYELVTDVFFRKVRDYEFISLSSMFPYARWLWQSEDYDRWFASDGFMAELMGGFKAVSVSSYGQNLPLYVSTQGKLSITHPLTDYVSVSGGTEFGANFSRTGHGKIVLPGELYGINRYDYDDFTYDNHDRALDNRYRFAMGMGFYREGWQTPVNSSHIYGLVSAGISLQWRGSGIFLTGGFAKDGEPNPWSEFSARRLFGEPKIRIKTQIFDLVFGQSVVYSMKSSEKRSENHIFLNICGGIL
jgi:NTE family protein